MNRHRVLLSLLLTAAMAALTGCSKESPSGPGPAPADEDRTALQQLVVQSDSLNDFSTSDEATIDDNGIRPEEYEALAKLSPGDELTRQVAGDSTYPVKWGRRIFWERVVRTFTVEVSGDTIATVVLTKTLPGSFWVGWGIRTFDAFLVDTIVKKPFVETVVRKFIFRRIARHQNALRNWVPVAMTMVRGTSGGANAFAVASMEVSESAGGFSTSVTDPLATWFRLGWLTGSIPVLPVRDSVTVRVTLQSSDADGELVYLRHGIEGSGTIRRRAMMPLVSVSGGAGSYTRVYERTFVTSLPPFVFIMRFNAVVDIFSWGTVYSLDAPFANEFWGAPYIVARR